MFIKNLKYLTLIILSLFSVSNVYSSEQAQELNFDNITSTSIDLEWEKVDDVVLYQIIYGTESGTGKTSKTDYIDVLNYSFSDLEPKTTYYFSLVGFDELGDENYESYEIAVNTLEKTINEDIEDLYLEDSYMIGKNEIELIFSNDLEEGEEAEREFKIESINNFNDYFEVIDSSLSQLGKNRIILELDGEPAVGEEYSVIVLSIKDIYNQNIENGVDSDATFLGVKIEEKVELNSAKDEPEKPVQVEEDEKDEEEPKVEEDKKEDNQNAGKNISEDEVNTNILKVSKDNSKLPKTGPEQFLILILAFIFGALVFVYKFKKS